MNLERPVKVLFRVPLFVMISEVNEAEESFFLYNSLKPLIIPLLEFSGGSCHDAWILLEVAAVTKNLSGACEGTGIEQTGIA